MSTTVLSNLNLIDGTGNGVLEHATVTIKNRCIVKISQTHPKAHHDHIIDCRGQFLLPGLIDSHVHMGSIDASIVEQHRRNFPSYSLLRNLKIIKETLDQGFTTVRDCGGVDPGLKKGLQENLIPGPRIFVSGQILSQTGGHGDFRLPTERHTLIPFDGGVGSGIYDGVDEVRKAVREQLRQGVDFIKLMAGGGVTSPADEVTHSQYSPEELRVAVYEAESAGTYVAAHCYCDRSIINCAEAGVKTIEHGNLMTKKGAEAMKKADAYFVPTVAAYEMLDKYKKKLGLSAETIRKNAIVIEKAYKSIEVAKEYGLKIGCGSDLLGQLQANKGKTLSFMAQVLGEMGAIVAATKSNAEIIGIDDKLGTIEVGKLADLVLINSNPLKNINVFEDFQNNLTLIVKGGEIYKNLLD